MKMQNQMPAQQGDADTACIVSVVGGGVWQLGRAPTHYLHGKGWEGVRGQKPQVKL